MKRKRSLSDDDRQTEKPLRPVRSSIDIEAHRESVWRLIAEFGHWPRWGPTVTDVRSNAEAVAPGVTGSVRTPLGLWLPFVVTDVTDGVSWSWKVGGITATGHELRHAADGRSRLEFSAPWYLAPYRAVLRSGLRNVKTIAERENNRFAL